MYIHHFSSIFDVIFIGRETLVIAESNVMTIVEIDLGYLNQVDTALFCLIES